MAARHLELRYSSIHLISTWQLQLEPRVLEHGDQLAARTSKIPLRSCPKEQVAQLGLEEEDSRNNWAIILDRSLIDIGGFLDIPALPCTDFLCLYPPSHPFRTPLGSRNNERRS